MPIHSPNSSSDKTEKLVKILDQAITKAQEAILDPVLNRAQSTIPMPLQIKGMHMYQKTKKSVVGDKSPVFVERPIPPVEDVELADIDVSNPFMFRQGRWQSYFKRLRDEAPVHYQPNSPFGPYWSITRYDDIVTVDKDNERFSAEPQIIIGNTPEGLDVEMFIAMDPPRHDQQRGAVQGVVAPQNLQEMEELIRTRVREVLDGLPEDTPFDWVDTVSIELTSRMLATLLDFPYEERRKLVYWTDTVAGSASATGGEADMDEMFAAAADMARAFSALWYDKKARLAAGEKPGFDLFVVNHRGDRVAVAALRELGGGLRDAQRDHQVARHVLAADRQHGGVDDGAL